MLRVFTLNVPFRFLRPWIDTSDDKQVVERSQTFENVCLYALKKEQNEWWVEINPAWSDYLKENYRILMDFAYWNLTLFLQTRNPNVPNIPNKLINQNVAIHLQNNVVLEYRNSDEWTINVYLYRARIICGKL